MSSEARPEGSNWQKFKQWMAGGQESSGVQLAKAQQEDKTPTMKDYVKGQRKAAPTKEPEKWKSGQQFSESRLWGRQTHTIQKVVPKAFCGNCNRNTIQLQSSTKGLDNDESLFCTRCEVHEIVKPKTKAPVPPTPVVKRDHPCIVTLPYSDFKEENMLIWKDFANDILQLESTRRNCDRDELVKELHSKTNDPDLSLEEFEKQLDMTNDTDFSKSIWARIVSTLLLWRRDLITERDFKEQEKRDKDSEKLSQMKPSNNPVFSDTMKWCDAMDKCATALDKLNKNNEIRHMEEIVYQANHTHEEYVVWMDDYYSQKRRENQAKKELEEEQKGVCKDGYKEPKVPMDREHCETWKVYLTNCIKFEAKRRNVPFDDLIRQIAYPLELKVKSVRLYLTSDNTVFNEEIFGKILKVVKMLQNNESIDRPNLNEPIERPNLNDNLTKLKELATEESEPEERKGTGIGYVW